MKLKLSFLLLLALQVSETESACVCYQQGNYTGKTAPLSNSYDQSNFNECYTECGYIAYSGDDTYGWTNLKVQWGTVASADGVLEIFEGTSDQGVKIIQVNAGENVLETDPKYLIKSSTSSIYVKYSQSGTAANTYYGNIKAVSGLAPTPGTTTTTAIPPTTTVYNNTNFRKNPSLITHDLLVVVNQHTSGGILALIKMNSIIGNFVSLLSFTQDINSSSGTRLSLATLNPYDPYYSFQGDLWQLDSTTLMANLPKNGITIQGNIDQALIGLVNVAFKVNSSSSTDSRPNVQRSVLLLTAEWPSTATLNEGVKKTFSDFGVNLLVVGYNLPTNPTFFDPDRWYNAVNTTQSNDALVASFVNPFYLNDKSSANFWCPQGEVKEDTAGNAYFFEPSNYAGPNGTLANSDWLKYSPYYGQNSRYCNFANNEYIYNKPEGVAMVKVTVFYELEAGRDSLSFYDADNNFVASFTGYDISGSSFYHTSPILKATFTSDNQSVYRGFFVQISPSP